MLGIAVFVGMHTANQSVLAAFSQTIDRIAGKTELQITAGEAGFGEDVLEKVQSAPTVRVAVPVIEAVVESRLPGQGNLLVLGIDMTGDRSLRDYDLESGDEAIVDDPLIFLAQPDSLIVSKELADRNGLAIGSRLPLETADGEKPFTVRGIMKPSGLATAFGGNLAIMDVYAAQQMFGRGRTFDRIDLALDAGRDARRCARELAALLGPGFEVQPPASRGRQAETCSPATPSMVNISSVFALFIGMFIIYNSFATAVTRAAVRNRHSSRAWRHRAARSDGCFSGERWCSGLIGSVVGLVRRRADRARHLPRQSARSPVSLYGVGGAGCRSRYRPRRCSGGALAIGVATSLRRGRRFRRASAARVDPVQALKKGPYQSLSAGECRRPVRARHRRWRSVLACLH